MEHPPHALPPHDLHLGRLLVLLGLAWGLSVAGIIAIDFWRFAGPGALLAVGVSMLWNRVR